MAKVKELMANFDKCVVQQIPRNENERANALSKFGAMVSGIRNRRVTIIIKEYPAIGEVEEMQVVGDGRSWKSNLTRYLKEGTLPNDPSQAKRIKFKAAKFTLIGDELYKRTIDGPLLKCLGEEKAQYVLKEIHEGSCGNHSGGRLLAQKVTRQGYFG
ncbi:UNVERIFIED_CONTAM: hypothetical protein Slati_4100100 [Sesamum latifolium]|uniref:Reverse transcriptase domain-containing protein n=1 Tax=Sesamum latifolium TaxID=2727402 RepID=A0AAW2T8H6_9LAMI